MHQRTMLRIVYWLVFGCLLLLSVSPNPVIQRARSGYFIDHMGDPAVLVIGIIVVAVFVWIGLQI